MTAWASVRLGVDLHLVVDRVARSFLLTAQDNEGEQLDVLGTTTEAPTDAILSAARATAILLHPDRVEPPPAQVDHERPITPHAYERDRSKPGFRCKHCPLDPHHPVHDKTKRADR